MKKIIIPILILSLPACGPDVGADVSFNDAPNDPQVEQFIFERCMKLAQQPSRTHYNDADETVSECRLTAMLNSKYCPEGKHCTLKINSRENVRMILPEDQR